MSGELVTRSKHRAFAGEVGFYSHASTEIGGEMRFAVYVPPQAQDKPVPVLTYLAGLTCTEETFIIKAGALQHAAEFGLMLVAPDTSPRDRRHPGDDESWDFGLGAGFYLDATQEPWRDGYRMHAYVTKELPEVIGQHFPARRSAMGIFGHSMGGHGALVAALRNPGLYRSVSAFAPIAAPSQCPWGQKAFGNYLGPDQSSWAALGRDGAGGGWGALPGPADRPGRGGSVPGARAASASARGCLPGGRPAPDPAPPRRL